MPSVAKPALPVNWTVGEAPKPVPLMVTLVPPFAASGENELTFGSTLNGLSVLVGPPAFVTAIGPSTAAAGTVTFNVVPPMPTVYEEITVPLNLTLVVPVKVLPVRTM